jgi:hypothetical protein
VTLTASSAKAKGPATIEVMQISEVSFDWKFMVLVGGDLRIHLFIRLQLKIGSVFYKKWAYSFISSRCLTLAGLFRATRKLASKRL